LQGFDANLRHHQRANARRGVRLADAPASVILSGHIASYVCLSDHKVDVLPLQGK
jgi:hypothetical protein